MADHSVLNPLYGTGRYRRAILLGKVPGAVSAALEDCNHGFTLTLEHNGAAVTAVRAETHRAPLTTCVDAPQALDALVGFPLDGSASDFRTRAKPTSQCTHLFDLASLALAHARRGERERRYDVVVEDAVDGLSRMSVQRNGTPLLEWLATEQHTLVEPDGLAGRPIMSGFHAWASSHYSGDAFEAAVVLQRGYFVAQARRFNIEANAGQPALGNGMRGGVCYSYNQPAIAHAYHCADSARDFSDCPEQLLKFL
ncbi:MAG TPA: DUF2889 domain-containing protein [Spongiibacteraceae bacterium]|jgi:hypothetical protein|nr:DUF2889 domain-containing protein [Spongiibacteraceae bacterium]HUH37003.1 DUF2889 domain-containing protein [Spongiibacteraceae bacterium]